MLFSFTNAILSATVGYGVTKTLEDRGEDSQNAPQDTQSVSNRGQGSTPSNRMNAQNPPSRTTAEKIEALHEMQRRTQPPADAIEGWFSTTINDLAPGGSVTVEIVPNSGYEMEVERIEFTREDDHSYTFLVGGVSVASGHKWRPKPTKSLTNGQKIIAKVTNNTDDAGVTDRTTDLDFEAQTWGWATDNGLGRR